METIGKGELWSYFGGHDDPRPLTNGEVRNNAATPVRNYLDLARKVATLQYLNRNFVLVFRGQASDHKNRNHNTSLQPSLMRPLANPKGGVLPPTTAEFEKRFQRLRQAEAGLLEAFNARKLMGRELLTRQRILRWTILQHYEICATPLLDVSHSLRIAASFASLKGGDEAFLFVLGLPNLSGAITASAEAGLQIVRLASVCPPQAVRPHIQEGYLLGEYPGLDGVEQAALFRNYEVDFGRRLVAKFRFNPTTFWDGSPGFPRVPKEALYPDSADDPLCAIAEEIGRALANPQPAT